MFTRLTPVLLLLGLTAACSQTEDAPVAEEAAPTEVAAAGDTVAAAACAPMGMPLADRASPYDSVTFALGGAQAKLCYGRPSMNERVIYGGLVPYDTLWRTGANEPTTIHLPVAATIAGMRVEPGSYTIYTVPGQQEWDIIVNRSISQWGIESEYTPEVRAQEVGRASVPSEQITAPVETFVISAEETPNGANLVLDWERTRVRIPIERA